MAIADQLMWATLLVTEMVEIYKILQKYDLSTVLFYVAEVQDLFDHIQERRKRGENKWREAQKSGRKWEKEGRKTVDRKTYYNAHALR